jgi:hypothetical protein
MTMSDDDTQAGANAGEPETTVDASGASTVDRAELAWSTEPETGAELSAPETEPTRQHGRAVSVGLVVLVRRRRCGNVVCGNTFRQTAVDCR